jgi:hypothetical protein
MARIVTVLSDPQVIQATVGNATTITVGSSIRSDATLNVYGNVQVFGGNTTFTNAATVVLATFPTTYRSAKYVVSTRNGTDTQVTEILITSNTTAAVSNVTSTLKTSAADFVTFTANLNVGNVELVATGTGIGSNNTSYSQRSFLL